MELNYDQFKVWVSDDINDQDILDRLAALSDNGEAKIKFNDELVVKKLLALGFRYAATSSEWPVFLVYVYEDKTILSLFLPQSVDDKYTNDITYCSYVNEMDSCWSLFGESRNRKKFNSYDELFEFLEIK